MNKWVLATRPWSFPASATPALIAFAYVFWMSHSGLLPSNININWMAGLWALFGAVLFQIAGNLISDYYDFRRGVDRKDTFGSSRMLVDGVFSPRTIWMFGVVILAVGVLLGLVLVMRCGSQLLWIGIIGVLAAYFYYILKYHALGDLLIFVIYGQLIALGTTYVMTSVIDWPILTVSAPIGFLIVNILHVLCVILVCVGFGCSKDDVSDPSGTVMLNMLNEKSGGTRLGTSDIYINEANNFYTRSCYIADCGNTGGVGKRIGPVTNNLVREVAVAQDHMYQAFDEETIMF